MDIKKLDIRINKTSGTGLFHDSRGDTIILGKAINILIDKVNELVVDNNKLRNIIEKHSYDK